MAVFKCPSHSVLSVQNTSQCVPFIIQPCIPEFMSDQTIDETSVIISSTSKFKSYCCKQNISQLYSQLSNFQVIILILENIILNNIMFFKKVN